MHGPVVMYGCVHGVGVLGQVTATQHCTAVVSLTRPAGTTARAIWYWCFGCWYSNFDDLRTIYSSIHHLIMDLAFSSTSPLCLSVYLSVCWQWSWFQCTVGGFYKTFPLTLQPLPLLYLCWLFPKWCCRTGFAGSSPDDFQCVQKVCI